MFELVNFATNFLAFADVIVFGYLSWLLARFLQKISGKQDNATGYFFYIAWAFYAFYRAGYAIATLPEPRQNFFEIALVSNFLFATAGISFYIAAKKLLKHSRTDINGYAG